MLRSIAEGAREAPNLIDGAVITSTIAGELAYFEADSLAAVAGGVLHVGEIKSFAYTDGVCDSEKLGAACDQAAWYILLCRMALEEMGLDPAAISSEAFIILPLGIGLTPTLLRKEIGPKVRRAEIMLEAAPDPRTIFWMAGRRTAACSAHWSRSASSYDPVRAASKYRSPAETRDEQRARMTSRGSIRGSVLSRSQVI